MGYNIDSDQLNYLKDGFEAYGFDKQQTEDWLEKNKQDLTTEFMASIYEKPHKFFCHEVGLDEEKTGLSEDFYRVKHGVMGAINDFKRAIESGEKLEFNRVD